MIFTSFKNRTYAKLSQQGKVLMTVHFCFSAAWALLRKPATKKAHLAVRQTGGVNGTQAGEALYGQFNKCKTCAI